ncbi:MAG: MiaB/RimO family radical SAM methylthiotransferase, partial [Planctomycetota bacterium]
RAFLKIQDGCDESCTYCIIPAVRGVSVSRDPGEVLAEARHLAGLGYREIALTGVNTGSYGHDLGEPRGLADLLADLDGLGLDLRFRLNSLEPATVTEELLDAIEAAPCICRHFHVPLQHGDSRILKRMGRAYDAPFYHEIVSRIHARFPGAGIGADVMAGFPGETDEHFESGLAFVASLPLSYLHVFSYSERKGTAATRMSGHVGPATRQERSRRLRELDLALRTAFAARMLDSDELLLTESKRGPNGGLTGLTGSYLRVELAANGPVEPNELWRVRLGRSLGPRLLTATPLDRCPPKGHPS